MLLPTRLLCETRFSTIIVGPQSIYLFATINQSMATRQQAAIALQKQLAAYRATLNISLEQRALHGLADVPARIVHEIRWARAEIEQKKIELRRLGVVVEDQQNDFEEIVDIRGDDTYRSQIRLCRDICKSLQQLVFAGDSLWAEASPNNLEEFQEAVEEVKSVIEQNAVFFEPEDLRELRKMIGIFEKFKIGKEELINLRMFSGHNQNFDRLIKLQISRNGRYKRKYDLLVEKIRMSFKARIM